MGTPSLRLHCSFCYSTVSISTENWCQTRNQPVDIILLRSTTGTIQSYVWLRILIYSELAQTENKNITHHYRYDTYNELYRKRLPAFRLNILLPSSFRMLVTLRIHHNSQWSLLQILTHPLHFGEAFPSSPCSYWFPYHFPCLHMIHYFHKRLVLLAGSFVTNSSILKMEALYSSETLEALYSSEIRQTSTRIHCFSCQHAISLFLTVTGENLKSHMNIIV